MAGRGAGAEWMPRVVRPFAAGPEADVPPDAARPFPNGRIVVVEHHQAHAASAYFASPFEEATVLTLDHDGDFCCGARWHGRGNQLALEKEWYYPDSLGDLYSRVTELLGFRAGSENIRCNGFRPPETTASAACFAKSCWRARGRIPRFLTPAANPVADSAHVL